MINDCNNCFERLQCYHMAEQTAAKLCMPLALEKWLKLDACHGDAHGAQLLLTAPACIDWCELHRRLRMSMSASGMRWLSNKARLQRCSKAWT